MTANTRQAQIQMGLQSTAQAETAYLHKHGTYSCSLQELSAAAKASDAGFTPDVSAEMLKRNGYKLTLSDCTGSSFKVAAEPEAASAAASRNVDGTNEAPPAGLKNRTRRAYCSDQTGSIRFASDGSAQTCFSSGRKASEIQEVTPRIDVVPAR